KNGGAIYIGHNANVTMENTTIKGNRARWGGAVYNCGHLRIVNCSLNGNIAKKGGSLYNKGSCLEIDNSNICYNKSIFGYNEYHNIYLFGEGGAIYNSRGNLNINNCSLAHNTAQNHGGVIDNRKNATMTLTKIIFRNNLSSYGGCITNEGTGIIEKTIMQENMAEDEGFIEYGGAVHNKGDLTINESIFTMNDAVEGGGAIHNDDEAMVRLSDTLLTNNTAHIGGSITNHGKLNIDNCIFRENMSKDDAGAIENSIHGTIELTNSIFTKNLAEDNGGAISNNGTMHISNTTLNYNVSGKTGGAIINWMVSSFTGNSKAIGKINIKKCLIENNVAEREGGIANGGSLTVKDTIIKDNTSNDDNDIPSSPEKVFLNPF
ncbi:MAG: hypothetical protein Q4Q22_02045, partial [Methanosphaera sp.]|nr:hypothetical protein [Methanosphaera sp.]